MAEEIWCSLLQNVPTFEVTSKRDLLLKASVSLTPWDSFEKLIAVVSKHYFSFDFSWALLSDSILFCFTNDELTECNQFPYRKENVNSWFVHEIARAGQHETHRVNIMNVNESGGRRKCYVNQKDIRNFPEGFDRENFEVFVHGTNHEGAKNIIERGIVKMKGSTKCDFSSGDGFYLDKDFDRALEWASADSSSPAVLVWLVERNEFRERLKGLDLRMVERNEEHSFQNVVLNFRSGKPDPGFLDDLNRRYDYIEGPWSTGPWPRNGRVRQLKGRATPLDETYQLCLRNDRCIELFNTRKLHSAVFFKDLYRMEVDSE